MFVDVPATATPKSIVDPETVKLPALTTPSILTNKLLAIKRGSPLAVGYGEENNFIGPNSIGKKNG